MNNILITGCNGFVGSKLAEKLSIENNIIALCFDRHFYRQLSAHHIIYGDIRDAELMKRIIGDYEINTIYHMASQAIVRVCESNPYTAYDINVMGVISILEAVRTVGSKLIESIVISTSDKVYGHAQSPYTEDTPFQTKFTYESSKACQDIVSLNYAHSYKLPIKVARCSNVYGPGDYNMSRLIPNSILRILKKTPPILYSGVCNYEREFIYIDDVVDAMVLIANKGTQATPYCVGGTGAYRIQDLISKILKIMNSDLSIQIENKKTNFEEIMIQHIDASRLRSLGWKPKISLDEGLERTVNFYSSYLNSLNDNLLIS
jgi:CDP-glucose 4,6-dehydratase